MDMKVSKFREKLTNRLDVMYLAKPIFGYEQGYNGAIDKVRDILNESLDTETTKNMILKLPTGQCMTHYEAGYAMGITDIQNCVMNLGRIS